MEKTDMDKALDSLQGVVAQIEAKQQAQKAFDAVDGAQFRSVGQSSPARVFFTNLGLSLKPVADASIPTMMTDGEELRFNPEFTLGLTDEECEGVVMGHEPLHCGMGHFSRITGLDDNDIRQQAADLEINGLCRLAGFVLPKSAIYPGEGAYKHCSPGLMMEEYYAILHKAKQPGSQGQQQQDPNGDPGGCGGILEAKDSAAADAQKTKWQARVAAAAQQAKGHGDLPGALEKWVHRVLKPKVDPWEVLREYMTRMVKTDRSWSKLNRRYFARGLYMPTMTGQALGDVCLLMDTSGSVTADMRALMTGFLEGVLAALPGRLIALYHHTRVYRVVEWVPEDGPLVLEEGERGGTSHVDAFERALALDEPPALIVALTDCDTTFGDDPCVPTIWCNVADNGIVPPFGQCVCVR